MTDVHQQTLAAYRDLGAVYSYGYGAMRSRYQTYYEGLCDTVDLMEGFESIISAVEFRSAEIQASNLMGIDALRKDVERVLFEPELAPTSAIYATPQAADGIARDQ